MTARVNVRPVIRPLSKAQQWEALIRIARERSAQKHHNAAIAALDAACDLEFRHNHTRRAGESLGYMLEFGDWILPSEAR